MIFYLLLGGAILLFVLSGRATRVLKGDGWRIGAGVTALMAFAGAAYAGVRSEWPVSHRAAGDRRLERHDGAPASDGAQGQVKTEGGPSLTEARAILGVGPEASKAEIQAAYSRLIRMAHPDKGGTAGLAAQLNAARDRLLDGK
jgi:hypothetical protein